ncbi:Pol Polyprotein [Phytophthora megakarya]|uniref:Pol Polyprotein n=1 Tax=Phytophthora megakarya TaxID=4795 RepID=A0A225VEX9_9STRA|nr:Pol Polyprotein [Phytophthora megakarya]
MGTKHVRVNAVFLVDPKNFREAMRDPRSEKWKEAMRTEIEVLEQNSTWKQDYGVNYTFAFSAVMEMTSGKVILAVSRIWRVPARHGEVPSAYVKVEKEPELEILLHIQQGMEITSELLKNPDVKDKRELALRFEKGLYGLKQSERLWNQMLHGVLLSLGFCQCYTDICLYVTARRWSLST